MYIHLSNLGRFKIIRKGFIYENRHLFVGRAAGARSLPSQSVGHTGPLSYRESRWGRLRSPGTRIFESHKQRGTVAGSTVAVSAYGAVFERKPAGRGCGGFLRAAEGIRTSPDRRSKGLVSERHRIVASSACIFRLVTASHWLPEGHHRDTETSKAAFRRANLCGELDCRHCLCPASNPLPSEERGAGQAGLLRGHPSQIPTPRLSPRSLLSPGKAV